MIPSYLKSITILIACGLLLRIQAVEPKPSKPHPFEAFIKKNEFPLLILGCIGGYIAYKFLKRGSQPPHRAPTFDQEKTTARDEYVKREQEQQAFEQVYKKELQALYSQMSLEEFLSEELKGSCEPLSVDLSQTSFQVLGVSTVASTEEITKAYKNLAVKWHPDKHREKQKENTQLFSLLGVCKDRCLDIKEGRFEKLRS
jgi:hypothetical protein